MDRKKSGLGSQAARAFYIIAVGWRTASEYPQALFHLESPQVLEIPTFFLVLFLGSRPKGPVNNLNHQGENILEGEADRW